MIIQVTRDIIVNDVVVLGEGALRIVTDDDIGMGFGPHDRLQKAYHVPIDLTRPDAGYVALVEGDYKVLPVRVGTVG